jgi:hypothetical protein
LSPHYASDRLLESRVHCSCESGWELLSLCNVGLDCCRIACASSLNRANTYQWLFLSMIVLSFRFPCFGGYRAMQTFFQYPLHARNFLRAQAEHKRPFCSNFRGSRFCVAHAPYSSFVIVCAQLHATSQPGRPPKGPRAHSDRKAQPLLNFSQACKLR